MPTAPAQIDKRGEVIRDMFAAVAPRYDLLNRLLSGRRDVAWRRQAAMALSLPTGAPVLDLCCGTGDQALALSTRGARVIASDFCLPMLSLAAAKYRRTRTATPLGLAGDALRLPFADCRFAGATVAFGLRNLADLERGLAEITRVLAPGAQIALLEFAVPSSPILRPLYLLYFTRLLPRLGAWLSPRGAAYRYLPESVLAFPQRDDMVARLVEAGLENGRWRDLTGGIVCLYTARKRAA